MQAKKCLLLLTLCLALLLCAFPALAAEDKTDATLSEIVLEKDSIAIRNTMTVEVPVYAEKMDLTITPSYEKADVSVQTSANCTYDEDKEVISLKGDAKAGETHTLTITVTSYREDNKKVYTLKLVRAYDSTLLKGLSITTSDAGSAKGDVLLASGDFDAKTLTYDLELPENSDAESIYLWITTDPVNDVWVNGTKVKSKNRLPYEVSLKDIKTDLTLRVEDEDELNTVTYTFKVDQASVNSAHKALESLCVSTSRSTSSSKAYSLYPTFDPMTATYHVFLPNGRSEAFVQAEAAGKKHTVQYAMGGAVTPDTEDYNGKWFGLSGLKEGDKLQIIVVDANGERYGVYTVLFHCGVASDNHDTDLDSLTLASQTGDKQFTPIKLDQTFSYKLKTYTATVPANPYGCVRLSAEAFDANAYVLVNGVLLEKGDALDFACKEGMTLTFNIDVVAANCDDTATYTLTVVYGQSSKGAFLTGLSARIYGGADLRLSPVFQQEKLNYTANVPNNVSYVAFFPTAAQTLSPCKIQLFGYEQESGKWTNYYQLNEGINNIPIYVYEGTSKEKANIYYVTIYRQPAKLNTVVSSQKLTVDGKAVQLNAYNINGNNFVKLRDIAALLNGTAKQFQVSYAQDSNSVLVTSNTAYTSVGQENLPLSAPKRVLSSPQSVFLNSALVNPMAYNIDGNNYLMLRDLALLLDFGMTYDQASATVAISTDQGYVPNK